MNEHSIPERDSNIPAGKVELKLPNLHCPNITGESESATEYTVFITHFRNVVGLRSNLSDAIKLTCLRSYLRDNAFKVISHLMTFFFFCYISVVYIAKYISVVRWLLSDLTVHNVDLLKDAASEKLIGHRMLSKMSKDFQQELVRKLDKGYPSFAEIEEYCVGVIRTLELKVRPQHRKANLNNVQISDNLDFSYKATTSNSNIKSNNCKPCKYYYVSGYTMHNCKKYCTYASRV